MAHTVGDVTERVFLGVNPGRLPHEGDYPATRLINVKDIANGEIASADDLTPVYVPDSPSYAKQRLKAGDVLVTVRGTLLKCALIRPVQAGFFVAASIAVLRPNGFLRPELLLAIFRSGSVQAKLHQYAVGSTIKGLHIQHLRQVEVRVPPIEEQGHLSELFAVAEQQFHVALKAAQLRKDLAHLLVFDALSSEGGRDAA
jgi:hypothetical protein